LSESCVTSVSLLSVGVGLSGRFLPDSITGAIGAGDGFSCHDREMEVPAPVPPPLGRARRSDASANRERALQAAVDVMRKYGTNAPMADIAAVAGIGVGTLYRNYPTRRDLLAALARRSYRIVLEHAQSSADSSEPALEALREFFDKTIDRRDELILPLHGGLVQVDERSVALRTKISDLIGQVVVRGQQNGSIRSDVTAIDVILIGALLAQALPNVSNWSELARRQAAIYLSGLAPSPKRLPGRKPTRAALEESFVEAVQPLEPREA
jgi:AcrR family transcriptional regulator